ncbi:leucine-rich repeat-containing protein 47 [Amyelois transitella]|uniref:leucine-rich repeat-containing protein 47 n=1 Tax=Amyelois transitella TaxID=680683 RepID=UPI00299028BF|nr:leucine-rich repeat-containing protein 47 [Amyelois transitella]
MSVWPEIATAKSENRHEIKLAGANVSKRISEGGLDKSVFQLSSLNLLNISDTCLTVIPDEIKRLVNLQSLLLFGNKIEVFNENITYLTKLKVLDLSRNQLKSIPDSLNNLKELSSINFSSNSIDTFPKLGDFPNLISIDVSNNKLTRFPDVEDANLPHLTDFNVKSNAIEELPNCVSRSLSQLKNFDLSNNQIKAVPGELASMTKLKELNLKGNKLTDKRLMKLVDQCRTKQVLDYIREHCPKTDQSQPASGKGKGKKGKKQEEQPPEEAICDLCHSLRILHVEDDTVKVKILEAEVGAVRPYILCCIVNDLNFNEALFKKFIQMQTRLHDTVCDKRNAATIATHDMSKIAPGDLLYTAKAPSQLKLTPLSRLRPCSGEQLFQQLTAEADALRKEKKRNVYSGIHKYLYLLEGKSKYPCLEDASGKVISFPPITNSEETKMSHESKRMLVEVTSHSSHGSCKTVMDKLLHESLVLGIGDDPNEPHAGYHTLTVQQVKVVDPEGNLKSVYPSRTDCVYEDATNVKVYRMPKK